MARCQATPPCDYKLNGEVHDPGCPARAGFYNDPDLSHLYETQTAEEERRLGVVLGILLARAAAVTGNDGDRDWTPSDVTGGEPEWLTLRRAIRHDTHLSDDEVADLLRVALFADGPELATR